MVLDRPRYKDDALAQQPRINVEAALAPVGLLDDDGDELRDDILMVNHVSAILGCGGSLHRADRGEGQAAHPQERAARCRTALFSLALTISTSRRCGRNKSGPAYCRASGPYC